MWMGDSYYVESVWLVMSAKEMKCERKSETESGE